jgi:hypothetical protein
MSAMTQPKPERILPPPAPGARPPAAATRSVGSTVLLTLLFMPAGLLSALIEGQKDRTTGHSQQPRWVAFAVCAIINVGIGIGLYLISAPR